MTLVLAPLHRSTCPTAHAHARESLSEAQPQQHSPIRPAIEPNAVTVLAVGHLLRLGGPATPRSIASTLGLDLMDVLPALATLLERGTIRSAGGEFLQASAF